MKRMCYVFLLVVFSGCASASLVGVTALDCGLVPAQSAPLVLIHDPADPERLLWVLENQIPTSGSTLLWGKRRLLATPEELAAAGPPPCGAPLSLTHAGVETLEHPGWTALGIAGAILQIFGQLF